jgi:DNA-binding NtrC family response regulator
MANAEGGEKARILVVDDDESTREFLVVLLQRKGYGVQSAADGEEAWNLLNGEPGYELVITDLNMPVLDGLHLLQRIRQRSLGVEVILRTGFPAYGLVAKAQELGAFTIVTKPHDLEQLLESVELALKRGAVAGKDVK